MTRITNPSTTTESAVYFVRPAVPPTACKPRMPLSIPTVEVRRLADSQTVFNLTEWTGVPLHRHVEVTSGQQSPSPLVLATRAIHPELHLTASGLLIRRPAGP